MRSVALTTLVVVALVSSSQAMAQANLHDSVGTYQGLLDLVRDSANQWSGRLLGYATYLFWSLTTISLVWKMGQLVIRQAEFAELAAELLRFIIVTGVFYTLMVFSVDIASAVINSFRQAGASAAGLGGTGLRPGDLFGLGVELAKTLTFPTINPALALHSALSGLIILVCFAFIAAFMGITLIEAYVVINISVFLMGFGGSEWTRDYALAMWRGSFAVGVKLMVLTLIVGIVMASSREWQRLYTQDDTSTFVILGVAFVAAYMCKSVPDMMASLITGVSPGGGGIIGGMAAAGMAFGAGVAAYAASQMGTGGVLGGIGQQIGGVADMLKGSGGPQGGASRGAPSFMSSGGGSGQGSSYAGPTPRVGGGGSGSSPSPSSGPSQPSPSPSSPQPNSSPSTGRTSMAHTVAEAGAKIIGTTTSIAMPGAEGSESLSVGPPPTPPNFDEVPDSAKTPENIIRPANPQEMPDIDTMEGLQEALNNRGKP